MGEGEKPECRSKQETADEERNERKKHDDYIKIITALNRVAGEQHAANDENTPKEKGKRCREIVTIIGLFLAAFIAIVSILTTHKDSSVQIGALQEQLKAMQADQRPWVGAPIEIKPVVTGGNVTFIQIFRNVGHIPTKGFYIDGEIIPGKSDEWNSEVENMCKTAVEAVSKSISPFAIIPGGDWNLDIAAMPTSKDRIFTIEGLKKIRDPTIIGCVLYGSPFDTAIHKTGYIARIDIVGYDARIPFIYAVNTE